MSAYLENLSRLSPAQRQEELWRNPHQGIDDHLEQIYGPEQIIEVGWPDGIREPDSDIVIDNTASGNGVDYGDEGKGRGADNDTQMLLEKKGVKKVHVTRSAGSHNAGHTIYVNKRKLALHIIPSGVAYADSLNIIGRETTVHPEDFQTEYGDVEDKLGNGFLEGRVVVSYEAKLNHDIDRAEEDLFKLRSEGKSAGGTGRGVPASEAHRYDRTGLSIGELTTDTDWKNILGKYFDDMKEVFNTFDIDLTKAEVPDFSATLSSGKATKRTVGNKNDFLDRIAQSREWLIDNNLVRNTVDIHRASFRDPSIAQFFEGAQAMGLHPSLGKRPDVTSTDPSLYGIMNGTAVYLPENVKYRRGYSKGRYNSVVGADWPRSLELDPETSHYIREFASEYGATTMRPRIILAPNLAMEQFNARFTKINGIVETHADVSRPGEKIKVAAYFTDSEGNYVPYQPNMIYQQGLTPHWVELPGWDGEQVQKAKGVEDLPLELMQFLAFKQARTGIPIEAITTGPNREDMIEFPGYRG